MRTVMTVVGLGLSACVSQSVHDALQADHTKTRAELTERTQALDAAAAKNKALSTKNDELTAANSSLGTRVTTLEAALKELEARKADLETRYAKALADLAALTKDKSKLQGSVEQMTQALQDLEKRKAQAEARLSEFRSLLSRFKSLIDAGKLSVRIVEGRMVVVLATDILFASGSAALSKEGKAAIVEVSQVLASIPKRSFQVDGHTDSVPIATAQFPSNWELASARALTVVKAMLEAGMPKERISAASFADARPVASNDSAEGKAANRRIEISIVPDLSGLPGFEELQRVDQSR
ncbi:MAG: OmpA family protein [Myxococcaceae bacterium]|nr:OmpA family protein [Myxococcaceae bacterium]